MREKFFMNYVVSTLFYVQSLKLLSVLLYFFLSVNLSTLGSKRQNVRRADYVPLLESIKALLSRLS